MADRSGLEVLARGENYVLGLWHNVYVTLWRDRATLEGLRHVSIHHRQLDKRFADGFCALAVMSMKAMHLDSEVRAEATRLSENPGRNLKAIAQVIEGTGFGAATARAVASGLLLVRKAKVPSKIFNDVPTGARWLMPNTSSVVPGPAPTPDGLAAAIDSAWVRP